jgi:ATP-dependent Clp protease ATP-binding subunit ClpA
MFERYSEVARRAIFFARYEASQYGSDTIETHHLLLGVMRADRSLAKRILGTYSSDQLRAEFASLAKEADIPTSVDLPLSTESKRVLAFADEEMKLAKKDQITTEHLLCGLAQEKTPASNALRKFGFDLDRCRAELAGHPGGRTGIRLEQLVAQIPDRRLKGAVRVLESLLSPEVTIDIITPDKRFSIRYSGWDSSGVGEEE